MGRAEEILGRAEVLYSVSKDAFEMAERLITEAHANGWSPEEVAEARRILAKRMREMEKESKHSHLKFMLKTGVASAVFAAVLFPFVLAYTDGYISGRDLLIAAVLLWLIFTLPFLLTHFPPRTDRFEEVKKFIEIREALKMTEKALKARTN